MKTHPCANASPWFLHPVPPAEQPSHWHCRVTDREATADRCRQCRDRALRDCEREAVGG